MFGKKGYVYLLHFERRINPDHPCQHYIGWAGDLAARVQAHARGNGARLCEVARERGIRFRVVAVWRGSRSDERRLKKQKQGPRLCPVCSGRRPTSSLSSREIETLLIAF